MAFDITPAAEKFIRLMLRSDRTSEIKDRQR